MEFTPALEFTFSSQQKVSHTRLFLQLNKQRLNSRNRCQAASIIIEDLNLQTKFHPSFRKLSKLFHTVFLKLELNLKFTKNLNPLHFIGSLFEFEDICDMIL